MKGIIMHTKQYKLEGLQYRDSANKIKKAVQGLNGVSDVSVANEDMVKVDFEWPATDAEIKQCIKEQGFKVL